MQLEDKLAILADAAKYDASCASSGAPGRKSTAAAGLGSTTGNGICHSYTPDGRCVSLLKVLLTNFCLYDCQYCINRRSSDVARARFTVDEVVNLTLDFYRRNYIEGLFLSSGIVKSPDHTMEQLVRVAKTLRLEHDFRGYIHLKTIPEADAALIEQAGRYADRLSVNIELPTELALERLAPEKRVHTIKLAMGRIRSNSEAAEDPKKPYAPAGQSTQLIVGADDSDDRRILDLSETLYGSYGLRRVYYSAYSPIPRPSSTLPAAPPPLQREHRLYQADWLMRYYGFGAREILPADASGTLPLDIDPKMAWALAHRDRFPVDVNSAEREMLLRVPGLGVKNVDRILASRRLRRLRYADLARLRCNMKAARAFVITADHHPRGDGAATPALRRRAAAQLPLL
jgi:putative DNA modification/repair radical SAM protein